MDKARVTSKSSAGVRRLRVFTAVAVAAAIAACTYYVFRHAVDSNFGEVVAGKVYRSAQPWPGQVKQWARKYKIKTIIDLRGKAGADAQNERKAADEAGVKTVFITLSARELPGVPDLTTLIQAIETSDQPILIHCLRGVDRTGVASAIAAMAIGDERYRAAVRRTYVLGWPLNGGIGKIFGLYERYCAERSVDTGGWQQFKRWATEVYHPRYYFIEIDGPSELALEPGQSADIAVTITNKSNETIPAADPKKSFRAITYIGGRTFDRKTCTRFGPETALPRTDIAPGATIALTHRVTAPAELGTYGIAVDVHEKGVTSFSRQGSVAHEINLRVLPLDMTETGPKRAKAAGAS